MTLPFGETITVIRPPAKDKFGDPVAGSAAETAVPGCAFWPRTTTELLNGQNTLIEGLDVFFPPGTDVRATDRLRITGLIYEVDGDPGVWRSELTGTDAGIQASATRVTG